MRRWVVEPPKLFASSKPWSTRQIENRSVVSERLDCWGPWQNAATGQIKTEDGTRSVNADCIRFDQVPHSSKLFLDFLSHSPKLASFYAPHTISAVADYARSLSFDPERRQAVAAVLERQNREWEASEATLTSIRRFREGAVAVVSGQQVGLFGGPFYSILKAASAVQLANELSSRGIDAVPLFWLATEDHDLAEVNQVALPGAEGRFKTRFYP